MVSQQNNIKNKLLVVTNDPDFKPFIEKILQKLYIVASANNGNEALEILMKEFKPGVIICSKDLSDMSACEFFQKTLYFVPNASRILISEFTNSKEIANLKNECKAYFYLPKPFHDIELIQALKISFDHYNVAASIKRNNDDAQLSKKLMAYSIDSIFKGFQAVSSHIFSNDRFYYTNRANSIISICAALGEELKFDTTQMHSTLIAAYIFANMSSELIIKFSADDPADITNKNSIAAFYKHYQKMLDYFAKDKIIERQIAILSQIWEHNDGSGMPKGLHSNQITREAAVIALAASYHSRVYKIPNKLLSERNTLEEISLTDMEIINKHNDTMKFLFRYGKWYDLDVFQTFSKLVEKGSCNELNPRKTLAAKSEAGIKTTPPELQKQEDIEE